jgi:hypothetical protein
MPYIPMTDASLEIQPAVTKTASFNGPALDLGKGYAPGGLGTPLAAVVNVTAIDRTTGDETYVFKIQQSADGSTGWEDIGPATTTTVVGSVVAKGLCTSRFVRLVLTPGGTTPSITYGAFLGFR